MKLDTIFPSAAYERAMRVVKDMNPRQKELKRPYEEWPDWAKADVRVAFNFECEVTGKYRDALHSILDLYRQGHSTHMKKRINYSESFASIQSVATNALEN